MTQQKMEIDRYLGGLDEEYKTVARIQSGDEELAIVNMTGPPGFVYEKDNEWEAAIPADLEKEEVNTEETTNPVDEFQHFLTYKRDNDKYSTNNAEISDIGRGERWNITNTPPIPRIEEIMSDRDEYRIDIDEELALETAGGLRDELDNIPDDYSHLEAVGRGYGLVVSQAVKAASQSSLEDTAERLSSYIADIAMKTGCSPFSFVSAGHISHHTGDSTPGLDRKQFDERELPYIDASIYLTGDPKWMQDEEEQRAMGFSLDNYKEVRNLVMRQLRSEGRQEEFYGIFGRDAEAENPGNVRGNLELRGFGEEVGEKFLDARQAAYGKILFAETFGLDPEDMNLNNLDIERFQEMRSKIGNNDLDQMSDLYNRIDRREFKDTDLPVALQNSLNKSRWQRIRETLGLERGEKP